MFDQGLSNLEKRVSELEEKLESNDEYYASDEFQEEFEATVEMEQNLKDQLDTPPDNVSEKQFNRYEEQCRRFKKIRERIRKIENETDINAGDDNSWLGDDDDSSI